MVGQLIVTYKASLELIAKALADVIKKSGRRTFISQGLTNQYILKHFGIDDSNNIKGYISKTALTNYKENKGTYFIENGEPLFIDNLTFKEKELCEEDIVLKGGNALFYDNGTLSASVLSSSPDLGTYKNIYMKAVAVSAEVYIPISLDKYIPSFEKERLSHSDIDMVMGDFSAIELPLFYGNIYTEIEAFKYLFDLDATLFSKGGTNAENIQKVFLVRGEQVNIEHAMQFLTEKN